MSPRLPLFLMIAVASAWAPAVAWAQIWPVAPPAPVRAAETASEAPIASDSVPPPTMRRSLAPADSVTSRSVPSKAAPAAPEPVSSSSGAPTAYGAMALAGARPGETLRLPPGELITGSTGLNGTVQDDTLRVGAFKLRASVAVDAGYDSNPNRVPGALAKGSSVIAPAFQINADSDWARNAMNVALRGRFFSYQQVDNANRFDGTADATYRYDINDSTWLFLNARASSLQQTADTTVLAAPNATINEVWGSARILKKFGQWFASLGVWEGYTDVAQTPGRSYTTSMGALRGGYEVNDRLTPFVEIQADRRNFESAYLDNIKRDSTGIQPNVGVSYKVSETVNTEATAGYLWRNYDNALVKTTQWPVVGLAANWQYWPNGTLTFRLRTGISETTIGGAFGAKENLAGLSWRQLVGDRLALLASLDFSRSDYIGVPGNQKRAFGEIGVEYGLTRYVTARLSAQRDVQVSTYRFTNYQANTFLAGLKVTR